MTRQEWGADESLGDQCCAPRLGTTFKMVFVHHTVGSNSYGRSESAAVVRGIYAYHTQSQGWCDIGYNFLVDRYGTVFEGRDGGIRKPVRGAHAGDYNTDSTGISLMGDFETGYPTNGDEDRNGAAHRLADGDGVPRRLRRRRGGGHLVPAYLRPPRRHVDGLPRRARVQLAAAAARAGCGAGSAASSRGSSGRGGTAAGRRASGVRCGSVSIVSTMGRTPGSRVGACTDSTMPSGRGSPGRSCGDTSGPGEMDGELGYPVSVMRSPRHGRAADFEHGSIFWSQSAGTHILKPSAILKRYRALGGAESNLAFPTSRVLSTKAGARTNFQGGAITFDQTTHRLTVTYE
ncbi:MAG: N-acetylmuramoyl-L-alanine amidase [Nocardioidaceae bacterium]